MITHANVDISLQVVHVHSKNCGVQITPPVLIEDHTMHFTPVLQFVVLVHAPSGVILTPLVVILTLFGVMFKP